VQASPPDMRLPIALGLAWPERVPGAAKACDWSAPTAWEFFPLDDSAFPAVRLARRAGEAAGTAPAVFNAVNEVCVDAFVAGDLDFLGIPATIETVLEAHLADPDVSSAPLTLATVLEVDRTARQAAAELIGTRAAAR
ncbi:MAG: 1-deoxy-D-xylulose-5-phosphate reductoisomerase, partial [Actinomycetales bacterium]